MRTMTLLVLAALLGCGTPDREPAPVWYDIGVVHREVTTDSDDAQLWFDRGLALTFGFNHEEAIRCFERAAQADPECAMAYWGKAYALGPNYNAPEMKPEACRAAWDALQRAVEALDGCTEVERALIEALRARYGAKPAADRTPLERSFAEAMRGVRAAYPDDADVAALTAESLMMLRPWKLWSPDGTPAVETIEIRRLLEESLARWPRHPALCHLYIHTMEAGPDFASAIPAAQTLESLTPGLGHLVHMPSHIYAWAGRYDDVVRVNQQACRIDDAFAAHRGRDNFYTLYRLHNYHFVAYGAMFQGQRAVALGAARRLVSEIPPSLLASFPDVLDIFVGTPYHVMVRFGMWEEILAEPEPAEDLFAARATWRYARGLAFASLGRVDEAMREQQLFLAAKAATPKTRLLFNNPVATILSVAEKLLAGEVEYRRGHYDRAFDLLRQAVALDEALNYDEPWGWMEPARHALGALLTEQGHYAEAIAVYERNLERFPENGWALHGLAECLRRLGREAEAAGVETRFERAWASSDTEIPGSCFCRTS